MCVCVCALYHTLQGKVTGSIYVCIYVNVLHVIVHESDREHGSLNEEYMRPCWTHGLHSALRVRRGTGMKRTKAMRGK